MDNEIPTPETNAVPDVPQAAPEQQADPPVDPMNNRQGEAEWWKEDAKWLNWEADYNKKNGNTVQTSKPRE